MKLDSIQSLRAAAAMLVMVFHIRAIEIDAFVRHGLTDTPLVSKIVENGYAGVDLFFVISGFIMVYVTGRVLPRPATSAAFLFARAARIYPLWWLFAGLMTVYFFVSYGVPWDVDRLADSSQLTKDQPWLYLLWSYTLMPQQAVPVFGLGWTLIYEMHFYVVFALLILLPRRLLPALLGIWAAAVIAGSLNGLSAPYPSDYLKLFFHPLSLEFIAGAFAALLVTSGRRFKPGLMLAAGIMILLSSLWFQGTETNFTLGWGRVLWFGIPSAIIVYALASLEAGYRITTPQWLVTLGDWSYAIYLSHILVLSGLRRVLTAIAVRLEDNPYQSWFLLGSPGLADNILFYGLGITLSLIASWMCFRFFERPAMGLARRIRRALFEDTNAQLRPGRIRPAIW